MPSQEATRLQPWLGYRSSRPSAAGPFGPGGSLNCSPGLESSGVLGLGPRTSGIAAASCALAAMRGQRIKSKRSQKSTSPTKIGWGPATSGSTTSPRNTSLLQVRVTKGVDQERVPDAARVEDEPLAVRSAHHDRPPRLDGGEPIDRALDMLDLHVLIQALVGNRRRLVVRDVGEASRLPSSCRRSTAVSDPRASCP